MNLQNIVGNILKASKTDSYLANLLDKAQEYAQVYLIAKQRQKGCNGFGEVTNLKEEFREVVEKMIEYCKTKNYIFEDISYDIDLIAIEFEKMNK